MKTLLVSMILMAAMVSGAAEPTKLYCTISKNFEFENAEMLYVGPGFPNRQLHFKDGAFLNVKNEAGTYYFSIWKSKNVPMAIVATTTTEVSFNGYVGEDVYEATCEYALSNPTP